MKVKALSAGPSRALLAMAPGLPDRLFDVAARGRLAAVFDVDWDRPVESDPSRLDDGTLAEVEVLLTGWGASNLDGTLLERMPSLRGIHHAGGSVRNLFSADYWRREIRVTTAAAVNAIPVAEYAVAMILLAGKQVFHSQRMYRDRRSFIDREKEFPTAGNYGTVIGIVGASRVGRKVIELLRPHDFELLVYDPVLTQQDAEKLGVALVELDDLFERSSAVSIHAPLLPTTRGMVSGDLLRKLPDGATLINTARGGLIEYQALVAELASGRIWAVLDTTDPLEPLPPDSCLYDLPNVVLTPHMAGSVGNELRRLGNHAVEQAIRLHRGEPLDGEVSLESASELA